MIIADRIDDAKKVEFRYNAKRLTELARQKAAEQMKVPAA